MNFSNKFLYFVVKQFPGKYITNKLFDAHLSLFSLKLFDTHNVTL